MALFDVACGIWINIISTYFSTRIITTLQNISLTLWYGNNETSKYTSIGMRLDGIGMRIPYFNMTVEA